MGVQEKLNFREVRDLGQILNASFTFFRSNFKELTKSIVYIVGPFLLISIVHSNYFQWDFWSFNENFELSADLFLNLIISLFISLFVSSLLLIVPIKYMQLYQTQGQGNFTVNDVWERVRKQVMMIYVSELGLTLILAVAFLLLIFPGIYLSITLSLVLTIRVIEESDFERAIKRSIELIKENWWFTAGLLIVAYLIVSILSFVIQLPTYILILIAAFQSTDPTTAFTENGAMFSIATAWASLAMFFYTLFSVVLVFHYYNLVERKEAPGLIERIENIE